MVDAIKTVCASGRSHATRGIERSVDGYHCFGLTRISNLTSRATAEKASDIWNSEKYLGKYINGETMEVYSARWLSWEVTFGMYVRYLALPINSSHVARP